LTSDSTTTCGAFGMMRGDDCESSGLTLPP
jgi:hypothetical protein